MKILGIESSCDETAVAIVENGNQILSSVIYSQIKEHQPWLGVVPEIAARTHLIKINKLLDMALSQSGCNINAIDAFAVTQGPGLAGALLVGLMTAKSLAYLFNKPLITVNHLEAHLYSPNLTQKVSYPHIGFVVSGGHTLLIEVTGLNEYKIYGTTVDDAVGEAFDKVAKMLHLGYPGGPLIDKLAKLGDPQMYNFPKARFKDQNSKYNFSFSGLKTAVYYFIKNSTQPLEKKVVYDICASFQRSAIDVLVENLVHLAKAKNVHTAILSGGVASNSYLREKMKSTAINAIFPELNLCMDNAAMVAGLAYHLPSESISENLSATPFSRMIKKGVAGVPQKIN